jgi:hypothetical protein
MTSTFRNHAARTSILVLFVFGAASAQDMTRARTTLQTLTAPGFHGRGYVSNGDRIAAEYLRGRFANMGLRGFDSSYFQPFTLDINTFPGKISLKTGRRRWAPGREFIVSAISQAGKGRVTVLPLDRRIFSDTSARNAFLRQDLRRTMVTYAAADYGQFTDNPDLLEKLHTAKALVQLEKEKLTAGVSTAALSHPTFEVVRKDWDSTARKARFRVDAELVKNYPTQNVIGYVPGKVRPDEFIAITAHYDHLGRMGRDVYFPGANDNASGVALLLELAEHYARPENRPDRSVVFMCFAAEEAGLLGSKHYTDHPLFPLRQIKFLINLDLLGTGDDGMMVVNGLRLESEFALLTRINDEKKYLPKLQKRDNAPNSDHYFFSRRGVRACFFYTLGGPRFYHDIHDRAETLPLTKFREVFGLITDFVREYE